MTELKDDSLPRFGIIAVRNQQPGPRLANTRAYRRFGAASASAISDMARAQISRFWRPWAALWSVRGPARRWGAALAALGQDGRAGTG